MVKISLKMINNVNIINIYEFLLQNIIKTLPKIYQNKTKVKGKSSKCRVQEGMSCINCVQAIWQDFRIQIFSGLAVT